MNRRTYLKFLIATLSTWGVCLNAQNGSRGKVRARRKESVIIVGAGISGLAAAETLRANEFDNITLLEGRDRVGGRVWTSQVWPDIPVDLGASWIHGQRGNPITKLAREAGVNTATTDYDNRTEYNPEGNRLSRTEERRLDKLSNQLHRWVVRRGNNSEQSLDQALAIKFSDLSNSEQGHLAYLVNGMIEQELAADAGEVSAGAYAYGKAFSGDDLLFPQGYMQVFAPRFAALDIRTNQKVHTIQYQDDQVSILTDQQEFKADRVIVTLPLGVLQRGDITFAPALPAAKQAAIAKIGMGCLNKLYLRFDKIFWSNDVEGFDYRSPSAGQWSQWLNLAYHTDSPVLLAFNSGSFARQIEQYSDEKNVADAMTVLRRIFGHDIPSPVGHQMTRWATDPFSFGSYSFIAPGVTTATVEDLARPVDDRLFFAGEATSTDYPSTVHGAYLSGQKAANQIAKP